MLGRKAKLKLWPEWKGLWDMLTDVCTKNWTIHNVVFCVGGYWHFRETCCLHLHGSRLCYNDNHHQNVKSYRKMKQLDGVTSTRKNVFVRFEVLTAVVMKSTIFWDITPCSPLKVNRRFGGMYRLHLQGRRISRGRNQHALLVTCFHADFLLSLFFDPEDGGDMFPWNVGWLSTDYMANIPEDDTLHNHCCENLKSDIISFI
jgi:hypothetical protein